MVAQVSEQIGEYWSAIDRTLEVGFGSVLRPGDRDQSEKRMTGKDHYRAYVILEFLGPSSASFRWIWGFFDRK